MTILSYAKQTPELGTGYVYLWTNLINGRMYIGSHNGRKKNYIGSGRLFRLAIAKYGIKNFARIILYIGPNFRAIEREILVTLDASRNTIFYNRTNNDSGFLDGCISTNKGKPMTEEQKSKISVANSGENNYWYGKKGPDHTRFGTTYSHTPESIEKIRIASTGREHSAEVRARISAGHKGKIIPESTKLRISFTKHQNKHIVHMISKSTCRWCNGDSLEQAIKDLGEQ